MILFEQLNDIKISEITPSKLSTLLKDTISIVTKELQNIDNIKSDKFTEVTTPLFKSIYQVNIATNILSHLSSVNNSEELRNLEEEFLPIINTLMLQLAQSKSLFAIYQKFAHNQATTSEELRIIEQEMTDSRLQGLNLPATQQDEFNDISEKLALLSNKFENNVLDATNSYSSLVEDNQLPGVLDVHKQMWYVATENKYKLTLNPSCYMPIMQYCSNRELRADIYYKYVTRASELGDTVAFDNTNTIKEILDLRHKLANLVGFSSYVDYSVETKMANSYKEISDFLRDLASKAQKQAKTELADIAQYAKYIDNIANLEAYDYSYYSEKLQQHLYSYSSQEVKNYFQLDIVLDGLFNLVERLFSVKFILLENYDAWDINVKTFALHTLQGKFIGKLQMDLHSRETKQSGAWMNGARDRYMVDGKLITPIAYIVCNFDPIQTNSANLISFDEVQTIFHEMGHALHHLLTEVNYFQISGINGVEWDAVELPSQLLENFVWDYKLISEISSHYLDKSPLPKELFDKMQNSRYFNSAIQTLRQVEFSLLDIEIHHNPDVFYQDVLTKIKQEISVMPATNYNRSVNTFSHIFAGGYAAGYYSYKWAELLSSHIYSLFDGQDYQQQSVLGAKLCDSILTRGGTRDAIDNFVEMANSTPKIEYLLKYTGINS